MTSTSKHISTFLLASAGMFVQSHTLAFSINTFTQHGPFQMGTVKIDRKKLQTVITWCSPTLLKMQVSSGVSTSYPSLYQKVHDDNHPLQVSVTVFSPALPFAFAKGYSTPSYVTSVCSPASIATFLTPPLSKTSKLKNSLGKPFTVDGKTMSVTSVNCQEKTSGFVSGPFKGPAYGSIGGVALIPKGVAAKVVAQCDNNGFSINIK